MSKKLIRPTDSEDAQITAAALSDPDNPPLTLAALIYEQNVAKWEAIKQQRKIQREAGRYTLGEAADSISAQTNEDKETILQKLVKAVESKTLATYAPGSHIKYEYESNVVRDFYEEVYWNDLNEWLKENEPLLVCIFPNPNPGTIPAATGKVVPSITIVDGWKAAAMQISKEIFKEKPNLNIEQIAEKTHKKMTDKKNNGEHGMTGRGGNVPSASTIKRHALTGIKK